MKKILVTTTAIAASLLVPVPEKAIAETCGWSRYIYNGGEPDNVIHFEGFRDIPEDYCAASSMRFSGRFSDGPMSASIYPAPAGFLWRVDDKQGVSPSFAEAFKGHMPALLTDPDHYEDGDRW